MSKDVVPIIIMITCIVFAYLFLMGGHMNFGFLR